MCQSIVTHLLHVFKQHVTAVLDWGWRMKPNAWIDDAAFFRSVLPYSTASVLYENKLCSLQRVILFFLCLISGNKQPSGDWLQEQRLGFYQLHLQAFWRSDSPRSNTILYESRKVISLYLGQLLSRGILFLYFGFIPIKRTFFFFFKENLRAINSWRRLQDPVLLQTLVVTKDFFSLRHWKIPQNVCIISAASTFCCFRSKSLFSFEILCQIVQSMGRWEQAFALTRHSTGCLYGLFCQSCVKWQTRSANSASAVFPAAKDFSTEETKQ